MLRGEMKMGNDEKLSQDEIDALLNVSADDEETTSSSTNQYLSTIEVDTLGEIGNISFGSSATTLSTLLNQKVEITTPQVSVMAQEELKNFTFEPVSVQVNYLEGFSGKNVFVIKSEDAAIISDIMLGGDGTNPTKELNEIHLSAVQEAMNQMMGAAATSMSTIFNKRVDISPPTIHMEDPEQESTSILGEDPFVKVAFQLKVGNLIDSTIFQLMPIGFAKDLVDQLMNDETAEQELDVALKESEVPMLQQEEQPVDTNQRDEPQFLGDHTITQQKKVQQADFTPFEPVTLNNKKQRNLDMLLDIPLKVTVELGRTKRTIKDILDLAQGSIVELDKLAGEPVDILVNEKPVAIGEVVVIDENFGVRVTDILSPSDRIKKLK
jgi:flagellar motor switch protein FliN